MKPQLLNLILFVLTFIGVATNTLSAQDFIEPCASDHLHNERLYSDPVYERSFFYLNQKIRDYAHGDIERSEEVFTLPIVVHIIHEGEPIGSGSNISDAQIQSAINDLNDAFRKTPGSPGDGNGADVEIEFCLASRDPDGNPTTGIVRTDGSVITDYADEGIEASGSAGADEEEVKALSTWPREDYVNIWIVNEIGDNDASGGTQGYAYFPIDDPVDGIVILHNAFGLVGNLKPNTDENKTLTHEMGHYFALHHTFYSTSSCEEEINCAEQGDHICDTPVTTLNANCNSPACSNQQVENYMDYTSENCRDMFTEDQKTRMRATLETERGSLLSSLGCVPVSELDCGISSIASPNGMICSNSFSPVVTITNYGSDVLNSVEINYGVDGNLNTSYDWSGTLEQGQSIEINLPSTSAGTGAHTFGAETNTPNATEDENDNNDLNEVDFSVSSGEPLLLQVSVDFFGDETTWEIVDIEGETVALGGPYTNNNQGNVFEENICAPTGCYDLIVFDDFGDGMSFTNGTYTLLDSDGSELVSGGGDFGDFEITNFCYTQTEAEGSAPIADFTFSDNTICAGANIDFVDLSSEFPTEWAWTFEGGSISNSTSENPQNIYFNSPGVFEVSLTASNEYGSSSHSVNVTVSENPAINLIGNSPTCYGLNNGSITTTIDYDGSYTFDWSNGSTNEDLNGLLGGTYTLTVETSNFCVDEETITLTNPMPMSIDLTIAHASCFELADGWIQSTINNGVGDITYDWSNGSSQANINDIPAGNYTLEITDENNCTVQESGTVNEPSPINFNLAIENILCEGQSGGASVDPEGGNGGFQVNWSTGADGNEIVDLDSGTYSVSISDVEGCTQVENFEVIESAFLEVILTGQDISCAGLTDGSASAVVNGADGDITYNWSVSGNGPALQNLIAGTYTLEVTDENGCTGNASVTIEEPDAINLSVFKSDITCHGLADGSASATVSGGTGVMDILWNNNETELQIENLAPGLYTLNITDENGCINNEDVTIIEPSAISITAEVTQHESCVGSDGTATANAMGGTLGFTYYWSNGSENQSVQELSSGIYDVVATDSNNCDAQTSIIVDYDCDEEVPTTQLSESDCDQGDFQLSDYISCDNIASAEMYQWKFQNSDSNIFNELFTLGSNNQCELQNVDGLHYNHYVNVSVRVLVDGNWSAYGNECVIYTSEQTPHPVFSEDFCETESMELGEMVNCSTVLAAHEYEWKFSNEEEEISIITFSSAIQLAEEFGLSNNTLYQVQVRAKVGPNWSDYNTECELVIGSLIGTSDIENGDDIVHIFPNPNTGEKIFIETSNLSSTARVLQIELFNSAGKLIEFFDWNGEEFNQHRIEINFNNTLAPGMYVLRIYTGENTIERKLIVR